jgi:hypothetical protein
MTQAQNRDPRPQQGGRQEDAREELTWTPPSLLPEPEQDPDYVYRWVRVSLLGDDDPVNVSAKRREGFEPVPATEQPHMTGVKSGKYKDFIEIGGLLLCKAPRRMMEQRKAHFDRMTKQQQQSVDQNLMKEQDARMPLFKESKSKTTTGNFGKGE